MAGASGAMHPLEFDSLYGHCHLRFVVDDDHAVVVCNRRIRSIGHPGNA
jgi:hypothetical protein